MFYHVKYRIRHGDPKRDQVGGQAWIFLEGSGGQFFMTQSEKTLFLALI